VAGIGLHRLRHATFGPDRRDHAIGQSGIAGIGQQHPVPGPRGIKGNRRPDATAATCHDEDALFVSVALMAVAILIALAILIAVAGQVSIPFRWRARDPLPQSGPAWRFSIPTRRAKLTHRTAGSFYASRVAKSPLVQFAKGLYR
jgi:hypothetical protein